MTDLAVSRIDGEIMTLVPVRNAIPFAVLFFVLALLSPVRAQSIPPVMQVDLQPLKAQLTRLVQAHDYLGDPLSEDTRKAIERALHMADENQAIAEVQKILDPLCLIDIQINPESRVKVAPGPGRRQLVENGWRNFLVKVRNEAGVTAPLRASSPHAQSLHNSPQEKVIDRWLDLKVFNQQPLTRTLSGLELEYRIISLYSRDAGKREAKLLFDVGQGTQDLGFRNEVNLLFECLPAQTVKLRVLDEMNQPTTGAFVIRDQQGRVYPSQAKRLAPDFSFHPQVYRADGEQLKLPTGQYTVQFSRGPESLAQTRTFRVGEGEQTESFQVRRWIDPSKMGWWSGDHHIHAAGCAHYTSPTEGVHAPDMMRHCLGEDLKVGCNLTWGPCFDYQKQFFTGKIDEVSVFPYLLRYDVEVSGFGSHQSGHLCLLRLKEQMYPGGDSMNHWPTLGLNTLKWAKAQGAVVGPAHSGWGLQVNSDQLPCYEVPPFDGIGANEYIVDVTHRVPGPDGELVPAVDFISTVDTPSIWELNIWYHTLNCGFRTRISGETDFPCIYGERVGLGRSYVKLDDRLDFDSWCEGIRQGRNYVGDGRSHILDFRVNDAKMGVDGSELKLSQPGNVQVVAQVAARLESQPIPGIRNRHYSQQPYWHIERARIGQSRKVPVELIVNGHSVARREIVADGELREITFDTVIDKSSWVALRILPSSHTNPVFVTVGDQPIRASRKSAEWCLAGVAKCKEQKRRFIRDDEIQDFEDAYEHAREVYKRLIRECAE